MSGPIRGTIKNGYVILEHAQRPHLAPFEMSWIEWCRLVHDIDNQAKLDLDQVLEEHENGLCAGCMLPFTADQWEDRHSDPDGEDVHAHCCVICVES